ncbi:MAG: insulinase family protein [Planctomycetes bacterium]|nr:insulinase family protein [Planctomycetota bacterium]
MPIHVHQYPNGLVLVAESMPWVESAALAVLVRAGCAYDPADREGLAAMTCEMLQRGCGARDSRKFIEDLELLGVDISSAVSNYHVSFGGAMPAENLAATLAIFSDLVRRPMLPPDQLEDARQGCLQSVRALEDDLSSKTMQCLVRRFYAEPWGRPSQGALASVERISQSDIEADYRGLFRPNESIISVAGKIEFETLRDEIEKRFGDWRPKPSPTPRETPPMRGYQHIDCDSTQTHIGIAFPSVPFASPDYYQARAAIGVLSDGMSSRLFTEVREKRALCYSVMASCHSLRDRGSVICYSGTTTERAQETLNVMVAELRRLGDGITVEELQRLQARLKSSLIMQQESSPARARAMASEWFHLGRVQTLEELKSIVDGLNVPQINRFLAENAPREFSFVTLGARQLDLPAN